MVNLILEKTAQVRFFTEMRSVFSALGIRACDYDWYLSDVEINRNVDGFVVQDQWLPGTQLERLITTEDIQFIWAVFSAVPVGARFAVQKAPFADGNSTFWHGEGGRPQLDGSRFEIVCWDSSATLLIGIDQEMADHFCAVYSDARLLFQCNQASKGSAQA